MKFIINGLHQNLKVEIESGPHWFNVTHNSHEDKFQLSTFPNRSKTLATRQFNFYLKSFQYVEI
jgi:hypothetical protein